MSAEFDDAMRELLECRPGSVHVLEHLHDAECPKLLGIGECTCDEVELVLGQIGEPVAAPPATGSYEDVATHAPRAELQKYVASRRRIGSSAADNARATLIERLLNAEPLVKPGDRITDRKKMISRLAGILAHVLPDARPDVVEMLARPAMFATSRTGKLPAGVDASRALAKLIDLHARGVAERAEQQQQNRASWAQLADDLGGDK